MGSRRDLILALVKKSNKELRYSRDRSFHPGSDPSVRKTFDVEKDLNLKLNRYVDYKDTPVIFDFYNEYKNSFKDIQQNKICPLKLGQSLNLQSNTNPKSPVKNVLLCDETMPESDEEPCKSPLDQITTYFEDSDDSVQDKDYIPEYLTSSESDDEGNTCKTAVSQTSQAMLPHSSSKPAPRRSQLASPPSPPRHSPPGTPSLVTHTHKSPLDQITTYFEDSDDSVQDKDYIPEDLTSSELDDEGNTRKTAVSQTSQAMLPHSSSYPAPRRSQLASPPLPPRHSPPRHSPPGTPSLLTSDLPLLPSRSGSPQRRSEQSTPTVLLTSAVPVSSPFSSNPIPSTGTQKDKGLNKAGLPRKRKIISESLAERKKRKVQFEIKKHELKPPCGEKCIKKCSNRFSSLDREHINKTYCTLNKEAQGVFIKGLVDTKGVKTRKVTKETPKRNKTYVYYLKDSNNVRTEVCKSFFLTTLGYNSKNDCRVLNILKRNVNEQKDRRGKYQRENKIDRDIIKTHAMKYNPAISHYRREHAPKRLYLPSDINMTEMHKNFCETEPDLKVSIETYRHVIRKEMNISFANLGNEECEQCALFQEHNKDHVENINQNCEICKQYQTHKHQYTTSRMKYKLDAENSANSTDTKYYSVDLQKVIMLPRLEQYKAAIFCSRIIAFNESFVPLGKSSSNFPIAVLWNEAVSGRSSQDILSTYRVFFLQNRDTEKVVLWADNCSSQNKNWALFSFLVNIINSNLIATTTIEIKYFEPGHTFMSADQFHHQVEKSMRNTKVYDFDDYVTRVKSVNSMKTLVKEMDFTDFYEYDECVSQHKIRNVSPRVYLKDITHVKVERGILNLKFKRDQNDDDFLTLDFLQNKVIKQKSFPELKPKITPRGISDEKKKEIIEKLVPLMPENRRAFWFNIPTSDASNLLDVD